MPEKEIVGPKYIEKNCVRCNFLVAAEMPSTANALRAALEGGSACYRRPAARGCVGLVKDRPEACGWGWAWGWAWAWARARAGSSAECADTHRVGGERMPRRWRRRSDRSSHSSGWPRKSRACCLAVACAAPPSPRRRPVLRAPRCHRSYTCEVRLARRVGARSGAERRGVTGSGGGRRWRRKWRGGNKYLWRRAPAWSRRGARGAAPALRGRWRGSAPRAAAPAAEARRTSCPPRTTAPAPAPAPAPQRQPSRRRTPSLQRSRWARRGRVRTRAGPRPGRPPLRGPRRRVRLQLPPPPQLDLPVDPLKRKTHEQAIVPWIDDRDVKLCPSCARSFNMMRRKHHCRLCGAIMCHDCTRFLELSEAKKMINMSFGSDGESNEGASTSIVKNFPPFRPLGRSSSNNSLNSVLSLVDAKTGEQHLRLCIHCKELLETREKLKETRNLKPIISQFYERLQLYITEVDQLCTLYCKMCQSLNCGEKTHTVVEAQELRGKILTLAGSIDNLSKKIAILGTKDVENPPKGRTLQLQQNIKIATNYYLKDRVIGLPSVPTDLAFKSLQESRR